jgi:Flp pilus assembly protein TadD
VQTEIADQVTSQIVGSQVIVQAENIASKRARPQDLAAYELTLLAGEELQKATEESNIRARDLLVQAVEKDPRLARAWVDLAWTHDLLNGFLSGEAAAQEENAALNAAQKAVELDPNDAGAHDVLGHVLGNLGKLQLAEAEFDRALQLNPGAAEILTHYAGWASTFGQPSRGAEQPIARYGSIRNIQFGPATSFDMPTSWRVAQKMPCASSSGNLWKT